MRYYQTQGQHKVAGKSDMRLRWWFFKDRCASLDRENRVTEKHDVGE